NDKILCHNARSIERHELLCWSRNSVLVIFNENDQRQLFLNRKRPRFKELTLSHRGIANGSNNDVVLPIELHGPSRTSRRNQAPTCRGAHAHDVQSRATVVPWHLTSAARAVSLGKISQSQFFN